MPSRNLVQHHGKLGAHGPGGGQLYASVPMELARDGKLSYLARSVAMYIWSHDEKWQQSASAVAKALGMDRGTVGKALAELEENGWFVREVHKIVGEKGKPRTAWERWHVQMTNRRFTTEEIRELRAPSDVRATPARSDQTCGPHPHGGAGDTSAGGADRTRTIEVDLRNAPEVHSSSGSTDQDEPDHESRALADASTENRPANGQAEPELEPASGDAVEASPEEHRPVGLHLLNPFASESTRRAEGHAREERAAPSLPNPYYEESPSTRRTAGRKRPRSFGDRMADAQ
ncbi:helix-turn-helix domain-containing protein [Rhodococcus globerulus]|uniref:helix-turn-helix domain-containing protein n=1 Tax=Rhodococcus globerulus TaxID=33008 RepID=UPI0030180C22